MTILINFCLKHPKKTPRQSLYLHIVLDLQYLHIFGTIFWGAKAAKGWEILPSSSLLVNGSFRVTTSEIFRWSLAWRTLPWKSDRKVMEKMEKGHVE